MHEVSNLICKLIILIETSSFILGYIIRYGKKNSAVKQRAHLDHGNKVHIASCQHLLDELDQLLPVLLLALQPGGVEVEAEGCPVAVEVPVEIMPEQPGELFPSLNVGTRVDHVTTWQGLVESGIVPSVQLVHHHLPHWMRPGRTVSTVPVALVRHPEVQGVGPDGDTAEGRGDGGVVDEELVGHHLELLVTAHPQVRGPHPNDGTVGNVGETFDN